MEQKKLIDLSKEISKLSNELSIKISNIIEENLKFVSEELNIDPKKLILQIFPESNSIQNYQIAIVLHEFSIENKFTYGEDK